MADTLETGVDLSTGALRPPYLAWTAWTNFLDKVGLAAPSIVDRGYVGGSGGHQSSVLGALRFFGLIDEQNRPTETLERLGGEPDARPLILKGLIGHAYGDALELGMRATQSQLEIWFRGRGLTGDTMRKGISFLLRAAAFADVQVSPHWKAGAQGAKPRRIIRRNAATPETLGPPAVVPPSPIPPGHDNVGELPTRVLGRVHPAVITVLDKIPAAGTPWTQQERTLFLSAFTNLLDLFHPASDPPASDALSGVGS